MRLPTDRSDPATDAGTGTGTRSGAAPGLAQFNSAPADEAETMLRDCCGSRRWARRLVAHRPYPDPDSLLAAADEASYDLTAEDIDEALAEESAHHPLSVQPGLLAAHTALRAAYAAYESKFGHAFVICLDGYALDERLDQVLAGVRTRLANDPVREREATAEELRRLTRGRLLRLLGRAAQDTGRDTGGS